MSFDLLPPIIFGLIISGVIFPINIKIQERFTLSRPVASIITCTLLALTVTIPSVIMSVGLTSQALNIYQNLSTSLHSEEVNQFLTGDGVLPQLINYGCDLLGIEHDLASLKTALNDGLKTASSLILSLVQSLVGNVFSFAFDLVIMMIIIFAILCDGERLKRFIFDLSPLPDEQEELFKDRFNQMNYVTLVCNGIGGLIQGVLGGLGLWMVGVSSITLWTFVMVVLAFIPLVGISIVTFPAAVYLIVTNHVAKGVALIIFSIVVGLVVENWFKPRFIGERIQMNSTFVLLTIIGGMSAFGAAGIFYGPLIGILFVTVVEIYHGYYKFDFSDDTPIPKSVNSVDEVIQVDKLSE